IPAFKKAIGRAGEVLNQRFLAGHDIRQLVRDRAWFVDRILELAWRRFDWHRGADIALLAVGGYGRGELHPFSDIDLLILLDGDDQETFREPIERSEERRVGKECRSRWTGVDLNVRER